MNTEQKYSEIVQHVMSHIEKIKKTPSGVGIPLLDIIYDFCIKNDLDVELVGDAIHSDTYLKTFIEKDCQSNNFFRPSETNKVKNW